MRIALDWFVNPDHVPLYAAGLGGELVEPTDPDEPLAMVVDGRADLALNYQPNVTLARAHGLPVRAVGLLIDQVLDTLMVRANGPMRAFAAYLEANPSHDDRFHRRAFAATVRTFAASQRQDERRWRAFAEFLFARGLLAAAPAATDLFTNELAA